MTLKLTDEQRLAVEQHGGRPVPVVDPESQSVFYLVSSEQLGLIRSLLEDEPFDVQETYAAQDSALREVWDDPALDVYNEPPDGETR